MSFTPHLSEAAYLVAKQAESQTTLWSQLI